MWWLPKISVTWQPRVPLSTWRDNDPDIREAMRTYLAWRMEDRHEEGAAEHGDRFLGDPLNHLEEELIDALFYVWFARAERDHLKYLE